MKITRNFYINLHLKDGLGMELQLAKASLCQRGAGIIYLL